MENIQEVNGRFERMPKMLPPIPGKVRHSLPFSVSGCCILIDFLFLGNFCQSHKSVGFSLAAAPA
jgi:hypothetical protein